MENKEIFFLYWGSTFLGMITVTDVDQPFFIGLFEPSKEFEQVKELFTKELSCVNKDLDSNYDAWEEIYQEILKPGLFLIHSKNQEKRIENPLLHIDGKEAWFRY